MSLLEPACSVELVGGIQKQVHVVLTRKYEFLIIAIVSVVNCLLLKTEITGSQRCKDSPDNILSLICEAQIQGHDQAQSQLADQVSIRFSRVNFIYLLDWIHKLRRIISVDTTAGQKETFAHEVEEKIMRLHSEKAATGADVLKAELKPGRILTVAV